MMIWSRWDWLIPTWTISMSKRPSSPATRRIQYSVIRTARSVSSTATLALRRALALASDRRMIASSWRGVIGTEEPAGSPAFRISRDFVLIASIASGVITGLTRFAYATYFRKKIGSKWGV